MAETYIWKPSTVNSWKRGPVFLAPSESSGTPVIVTPDGQRITGKYVNNNEGRKQWTFPAELVNMQGLKIEYGGQTVDIENGATSYEGSSLNSWQPRDKGSIGSGGSTGTLPGGSQQIGNFGVAPAFIGGQFPQPTFSEYDPIKAAPYNFIDPIEFSTKFNPFQRLEIVKNFGLAKDISLAAIDTEFEALQNYVPRSAQLKRNQIAQDNIFNQAQRTSQINQAVPDVIRDLDVQAEDARAYARGEVPNDVVDRALELGIRSSAADVAATSGFGVRSSAARKVSDLMSADKRIQLSQYGNQLLSGNAAARTNLKLAPTSYSNAGEQINVTPSISGSQLQMNAAAGINAATVFPTASAFSGVVNQEQYRTGLEQQTRQFNAGNTLQNNQFNAGISNQFALQYFSYLNSYVNAIAGANQTNINTEVALAQQRESLNQFRDSLGDAQQAGNIRGIAGIVSTIAESFGGVSGFMDYLRDTFLGGSDDSSSNDLSPDFSAGDPAPDFDVAYGASSSRQPDVETPAEDVPTLDYDTYGKMKTLSPRQQKRIKYLIAMKDSKEYKKYSRELKKKYG